MNQEVAQTIFYGNSGLAPEEFLGLSPRYSTSVPASAANASHVLKAGSVDTDNTSIWLIVWGDQQVHGIFPKGSKAGLIHDDYGEVTVEMTSGIAGSRMRALQERWQWKCGISVRDWRYAVRICNIDVSLLVAGTGADLTAFMIRAMHRVPSLRVGRPVFYMNRTAYSYFDIQGRDDVGSGGRFTFENIDGRERPTFRGIPVSKVESAARNGGAGPVGRFRFWYLIRASTRSHPL